MPYADRYVVGHMGGEGGRLRLIHSGFFFFPCGAAWVERSLMHMDEWVGGGG